MNSRYSRQADIVPKDRIAECRPTIIGVGAIGRQVALQLTAMGVPELKLVDFDVVEESNLASQGFLEKDLNRFKVDATAEYCWKINSRLRIDPVTERFRRSMDVGDIVFLCVDSIDTRRLIFDAVKQKVRFFVDGRMTAQTLRVITAYNEQSREHYPQTLFSAGQAYTGTCTAKTTIYCANIAAGLMIAQFTKFLRQLPIDYDIQLNLLASEINVNS
jgi:sulfur carrier protein ThiS adenylyltransferase